MVGKEKHRINEEEACPHFFSGETAYPRVLLVNGQAIGEKSGVGATLASLFTGWPQDRLAQIVPQGSESELSICNNNWILGPIDPSDRHPEDESRLDILLNRLHRSGGYRLSSELCQWITRFRPQIIYSYLELPLITNLVAKIATAYDVPVVPHLMDEWHSIRKSESVSDYWWFCRRWLDFRKILKHSPLGLSISDKMTAEYQKRYKIPFHTFMNSVDPVIYSPNQKSDSNIVRMVYAGTVSGLGRWPLVVTIAQIVQELNRNGYSIEFTLFIKKNMFTELPTEGNGVIINDFIDDVSLAKFLSKCDIAVITEGFEKENIAYTRLSLSSKIAPYLMAGCYILAIGPEENNSIRYIIDNNLGKVIINGDMQDIAEKIKFLLSDKNILLDVSLRNRQFALNFFNKNNSHKELLSLFSKIIK